MYKRSTKETTSSLISGEKSCTILFTKSDKANDDHEALGSSYTKSSEIKT